MHYSAGTVECTAVLTVGRHRGSECCGEDRNNNCSWSFVYCVIILCVSLLPYVYCFTTCVLLHYIFQLQDCWLEVSIRKVLRPATSAQVFLGFPVPISECWDGSQDSKLPLHASHVAIKFLTFLFHIYVIFISYLCTCIITTATGWQPICS